MFWGEDFCLELNSERQGRISWDANNRIIPGSEGSTERNSVLSALCMGVQHPQMQLTTDKKYLTAKICLY
jgi:hypothetical protein